MDFDDFNFQDEIELMNIERQTKENLENNNQTFGFNTDNLYEQAENYNIDN